MIQSFESIQVGLIVCKLIILNGEWDSSDKISGDEVATHRLSRLDATHLGYKHSWIELKPI